MFGQVGQLGVDRRRDFLVTSQQLLAIGYEAGLHHRTAASLHKSHGSTFGWPPIRPVRSEPA